MKIHNIAMFLQSFQNCFFVSQFTAVIPAGVNVAYICTQVKSAVDDEQSKALWVPRGPP